MSQIEAGYVEYMIDADYLATVGADFDVEAANDAVRAQLNRMLPAGVQVERNGKVLADQDKVDEANAIDWPALLARIDIEQILADHGR